MDEATRTLDSMIAKGYSPCQELLNIVLESCIMGKTTSKVSVANEQTFPLSSTYEWDISSSRCLLRWAEVEREMRGPAAAASAAPTLPCKS